MPSTAKAKGTAWETALVNALSAFFGKRHGLNPYRPAQAGRGDVGDLNGISPFVGQAKNFKSWEEAIRLGLDGAEKQKRHAGEPYGVAFVKRVRRGVGDGYAVMTVATWARLVMRLRRAEYLLAAYAPGSATFHTEETEAETAAEFPRA